MAEEMFLIPHDFPETKYHIDEPIPCEWTGENIREELAKRLPGIKVVWAPTGKDTDRHLADADFMLAMSMSARQLERARKLRWVHLRMAGPDHFFKRSEVKAEDFRRRGIKVTTSAGAAAVTIAEQVLCFMLMFSRRMPLALSQQKQRLWQRYAGGEMLGCTVGIIGLGAIGREVARRCKCLGLHVVATKRDPSRHDGSADEVLPADAYPSVMERADFLVLCCPITDATRLIINPETLGRMKPSAYLINVARGECIDEPALVAALKGGTIAGYGSDNHGQVIYPVTDDNIETLSPESELWDLDNVLITPNCATAGPKRYEHLADIVAENYRLLSEGKPAKTPAMWNGEPI